MPSLITLVNNTVPVDSDFNSNFTALNQVCGTGTTIITYSAGDILYASAVNTLTRLGIGTQGMFLAVTSGFLPTWTRPASYESTALVTDTLTVAESGKVFYCTLGSGTQTFTLPATVAGVVYTFFCADAGGEINISPAAADKITGKGIAGADDQDVKNTAVSNAVGDCLMIMGDGVDGWLVVNMLGTWAVV